MFKLTSGDSDIYNTLTNFVPVCSETSKTSGQFLEALAWVTSKRKALHHGMEVGELAKLAGKQEIPRSVFPLSNPPGFQLL